jgi:hypothetical protein
MTSDPQHKKTAAANRKFQYSSSALSSSCATGTRRLMLVMILDAMVRSGSCPSSKY